MPTIAIDGKIPIVRNERMEPPATVRASFEKLENLSRLSHEKRSWAATMLNLIRRLPGHSFDLADAYGFEQELSLLYPENNNIRPKIRQQLQVLRDAGILTFVSRGKYQLVNKL